MTDKNEVGERIYRKLLYYFENKIPVHIKLHSGEWKNGNVIDLSQTKHTLVLQEFVEGSVPILLEDINERTISAFREKKGGVNG